MKIWTFEHFIWTLEYLKIWTLEHWNIQTFKHSNIQTLEHCGAYNLDDYGDGIDQKTDYHVKEHDGVHGDI